MGYRNSNRGYEYRPRRANTRGRRPSHVSVEPRNNEPIEKTIKRFMRKVKKSGIADEYRKRRFFEKPSTKKRRQKLKREAVLRKAMLKQSK